MEKSTHSQLELFSQSGGYRQTKTEAGRRSFFNYIKGFEKIILFIIGFIIVGVVSFVSGVEKGKKLISAQPDHPFYSATNMQPPETKIISPERTTDIKQQYRPVAGRDQFAKKLPAENQNVTVLPAGIGKGNYTIQIATYSNRSYAEKEADKLRKRGMLPVILSKSGFIVLYVGNFTNKESARPLLSELKKQYSGCILRRL